jgi:hypothetical protein
MLALQYFRLFQEISFRDGFPLRGCIDIGSFYCHNNIFAGDTIVDSFNESEKLNFSGLIITDNALKIIEENCDEKNFFIEECVNKYIVPIKHNIEEYKNIVEWSININEIKKMDVKQYIFETFHAHNKEIDLSVMEKIVNTEKRWRFFYMKRRGMYFA